jgi:hypothetical protein
VADAQSNYGKAQRKLRRRLQGRPAPAAGTPAEQDSRWLISDFVTLGSPLTPAELLIARSAADLEQRKIERELPTAPISRRTRPGSSSTRASYGKASDQRSARGTLLLSFPVPGNGGVWELHHAAPFAVVRWTNIYDPAKLVFFGDIIGGPVKSAFGPVILDVDLRRLRQDHRSGFFTHTKYWALGQETKRTSRRCELPPIF